MLVERGRSRRAWRIRNSVGGKVFNDFRARGVRIPVQLPRQSVAIRRALPAGRRASTRTPGRCRSHLDMARPQPARRSHLPPRRSALSPPGFARPKTCAMDPGARNAAR